MNLSKQRLAACGLVLFSFVAPVRAEIRVLEETAIPFMSFLQKADFDQRFPGDLVGGTADLASGWYVIYEHASLNYYFGPILLESTGEDYLTSLTEIVDAAIAQRPGIEGYRLELSYEPSESSEANRTDSANPSSEVPPISTPLPPQAEPESSVWGFIKRIFGFG